MDRLIERLERRIGQYAIPNLILYMVGGMAVVWVASRLRPGALDRLTLDMYSVRHGQPWRLVTFLFVPLADGYMALFGMYFTLWVGRGLERQWGTFRFNLYYLFGALGTVLAALIAGSASNTWLDSSLLLAYATVLPDETILLFFILPLRVKWLGMFTAGFILFVFATGGWVTRASIAAAFLNYFLFFGGRGWQALRGRKAAVRQNAKREQFRPTPVFGQRVCAICGAREADGVDIRVCACAKCGGQQRNLCFEHARNH